jgi:hypothetical protein
VQDGYFDANKVLARFLELSEEMPAEVVAFVSAKLRDHPNFFDE